MNSSSNGKHRVRSANFNELEKSYLTDIIGTNYVKSVIENKIQNESSKQEKELMWGKIAVMFNANQQFYPRTASQLKQCYVNLKRHVKKKVANDHLQNLSDAELKVYKVICEQFQAFDNPFDCHGNNEPAKFGNLFKTYDNVSSNESSDFESTLESIIEKNSFTENNTINVASPFLLADSGTDDSSTSFFYQGEKSETAKTERSISILSNEKDDLMEIKKQGLIKRNLLKQNLLEVKIKNAKKKSKLLDLRIALIDKQIN